MPRTQRCLCGFLALALLTLAATTLPARGDNANAPIDWNRVMALAAKNHRGEALTPDEQQYVDKAKAEKQRLLAAGQWPPPGFPMLAGKTAPATQPTNQTPAATLPPHDSMGLTPITQMKPGELYKGVEGGLYGHCQNSPPESQEKIALDASSHIQPLDAKGQPAKNGRIALISIGISNTTLEFANFKSVADLDPDKNPLLALVDCAHGGRDAKMWADPQRKDIWDFVEDRLKTAAITDQQVQAVWIMLCIAQPDRDGVFPQSAKALEDNLITVLGFAKTRFPNLRIAYLSSREYGGYVGRNSNPEPYAYESAFSVRDLILEQINASPLLNPDPAQGDVKAPVVLWGPYTWADGVHGRASDELVYKRDDFIADGTHPSASGKHKITQQLLYFFKSDPTSRPWFVRPDAAEPTKPDLK